jgi:hypothetical protein
MPDARSPIQHHLVLHHRDLEQSIRRFYSLMIERDLFGTIRLVRNWGRIAPTGRSWWRCSRPRPRRARPWKLSPRPSGGAAIGICERCGSSIYVAEPFDLTALFALAIQWCCPRAKVGDALR